MEMYFETWKDIMFLRRSLARAIISYMYTSSFSVGTFGGLALPPNTKKLATLLYVSHSPHNFEVLEVKLFLMYWSEIWGKMLWNIRQRLHQRASKTPELPGPLSGPWTPAARDFALVMCALRTYISTSRCEPPLKKNLYGVGPQGRI